MKTLYGVKLLKEKIIVNVLGLEQSVPLILAEGMVGALPIFDTLENAVKYNGNEDGIFSITVEVDK